METLNFKKWLKSEGVDTEKFWEACKKKNQSWNDASFYHPRKKLKKFEAYRWIHYAFNWVYSERGNRYWNVINEKWCEIVLALDDDTKIKFGFKENK